MFASIYKSTIKSILRSTLFRTTFVFMLVVAVFIRMGDRCSIPLGNNEFVTYIKYLPILFRCSYWMQLVVMAAMLPVLAVFAIYDKDHMVYDIELAAGIKQGAYMLARGLAFLALYSACLLLMTIVNFLSYFFLDTVNAQIPIPETAARIAALFAMMNIPVGLFFVFAIIAVTVLTRSKAAGISAGVVYIMGAHFIQGRFFTLPPSGVGRFLVEKQSVVRDVLAPMNDPRAILEMLERGEPLARYHSGDLSLLLHLDAAALTEIMVYMGLGALLIVILSVLLPKLSKNIFS